jgi:hypothetical protein
MTYVFAVLFRPARQYLAQNTNPPKVVSEAPGKHRTRNSFSAISVHPSATWNIPICQRFLSVLAFLICFAPGLSHRVR